jgi:valyl-tRNA synthetase
VPTWRRVPARLVGLSEDDERRVRELLRLAEPPAEFVPSASLTTAGAVTVELDLSGVIDVAAERARLAKDLAAAEKERAGNATKLADERFLAKAPDAVIDKARNRLQVAEAEIARIQAALAALPGQ